MKQTTITANKRKILMYNNKICSIRGCNNEMPKMWTHKPDRNKILSKMWKPNKKGI